MKALFVLLVLLALAQSLEKNYDTCLTLNHNYDIRVHWTLHPETETVDIAFEGNVVGYLAVGITQGLSVDKDADLWIASVSSSGECAQGCLWDLSMPAHGVPKKDTHNDLTNVSVRRVGAYLFVEFTRKLRTNDVEDFDILMEGRQFMVYSFHSLDSLDGNAPQLPKMVIEDAVALRFTEKFSCLDDGFIKRVAPTALAANPSIATSGSFTLKWTLSTDLQSVLIQMSYPTGGWISLELGFQMMNPVPGGVVPDMITGWVDPNSGVPTLLDTISTGYLVPTLDTSNGGTNDVVLVTGSNIGGMTTITFTRLLVTLDKKNDAPILNSTMPCAWAQASAIGTSPTNYVTHGVLNQNGYNTFSVNFMTGVSTGSTSGVMLLTPGNALLIIAAGFLMLWVLFRMIKKAYKFIKRRALKKKVGYVEPRTAVQVPPPPPPGYSPGITRSNDGRPLQYKASGQAVDPNAIIYSEPSAPVQKNTFTGAYFRGSSVVVPKAVKEKQIKRATKAAKSIIEIIKDDKQRNLDRAVISEKGSGNFFTNFWISMLGARIPRTQITVGFLAVVVVYLGINAGVEFLYADPLYGIGSLCAGNALLVALPAARNSVTVWLLGIPFDEAIVYHRWLGRYTVLLALVHMILAWIEYTMNGEPIPVLSQGLIYIYAYIAFAALGIIFITSFDYIRRQKFEIFFYLHYFFAIFYAFGALHSTEMAIYTYIAIVVYALDQIIRVAWGLLPMKTIDIKLKDGDMVQIKFEKHFAARYFRLHKIGQYFFVNFPTLNPFEWHPFSISSGPDEKYLEIHVKALGDHTRKLVDIAHGKQSMWIRTDGPYGNHKINYRRFPVLLLCAGGIGITPTIGILKDVYQYGEKDPRAKAHHKSVVEKVYFVWVVQSMDQYAWFADEIKWCYDASQHDKTAPNLELQIYLSKGDENDSGFFFKGRPDFGAILGRVVTKHPERATTVFTCGPRKLVNGVWDAVSEQSRNGNAFHFHHETFEF